MYIKFASSLQTHEEELFGQFLNQMSQILDLDDQEYTFVENEKYDGSGYEFMFLLLDEYKFLLIEKLAKSSIVVDISVDLSHDLLSRIIFDHADFKRIYFGFEESRQLLEEDTSTNVCKEIFDNYILANVSADDVLEKITEKGLDSLLDIEKKILGRHS